SAPSRRGRTPTSPSSTATPSPSTPAPCCPSSTASSAPTPTATATTCGSTWTPRSRPTRPAPPPTHTRRPAWKPPPGSDARRPRTRGALHGRRLRVLPTAGPAPPIRRPWFLMRFALPAALALLLALPCTGQSAEDPLRIMPIGDSITEGGTHGGYRAPLFAKL